MRVIPLPKAPASTSMAVRHSMHGNSVRQTKIESSLADLLIENGLTGFVQNDKSLEGTPDIAYPSNRLAIFVHGCFWHRCPYCEPHFPEINADYWQAKFARNKRRDKHAQVSLKREGWRVVTVWECKLKNNPHNVLRRIRSAMKNTNG